MSMCPLYVPGLIEMTTRSAFPTGTESIAACTVLNVPLPSAATTRSADAAETIAPARHEHTQIRRTIFRIIVDPDSISWWQDPSRGRRGLAVRATPGDFSPLLFP